jgi:hypothetical protein
MSDVSFTKLESAAISTLRKELGLIIVVNLLFITALIWIPGWASGKLFYATAFVVANIVLLFFDSVLLFWAVAAGANPMRMYTTIPMPEKRHLRQFVMLSDSQPLALWYILQLLRGGVGLFCGLLFAVLHLALGETETTLGVLVIGITLLLALRSFYNESTIYTRIVQRPVHRVLKPASVRTEYGKQRAAALRKTKTKRKSISIV